MPTAPPTPSGSLDFGTSSLGAREPHIEAGISRAELQADTPRLTTPPDVRRRPLSLRRLAPPGEPISSTAPEVEIHYDSSLMGSGFVDDTLCATTREGGPQSGGDHTLMPVVCEESVSVGAGSVVSACVRAGAAILVVAGTAVGRVCPTPVVAGHPPAMLGEHACVPACRVRTPRKSA
jgi:hypothetical protein